VFADSHAFGLFSVSRNGLLAYQLGEPGGRQLTWFDRSGKLAGTFGDPQDHNWVEFSPDHKTVATARVGQNNDLWLYDVPRGLATRFTFGPAANRDPIWSRDGRSIAFQSNRRGIFDLYRKAADGTGSEELIYADGVPKIPSSWSPDGKLLLFYRIDPKTQRDIWVLPVTNGTPSKPYPWLATPSNELFAKFSPDGRWVAYESDESGRYEIYVAPFPGPGGKRQISTGGGQFSRWRMDGKEIFYVAPKGTLMAAEISEKGASIEVGEVRSLGIPVVVQQPYQYDVAAGGQRFLVAAPRLQQSPAQLRVIENWTLLLRKK
jgi:Tol biopolymer transport system component